MNELKDAIYGLAVADALGVPFEFRERGSFNCTDMVGFELGIKSLELGLTILL